jgi:hypothetical protein
LTWSASRPTSCRRRRWGSSAADGTRGWSRSAAISETDTGFAAAGIDLTFQNYRHPVYRQPGTAFRAHLSFLDALMNLGPEAASIMRDGRRPSHTLAQARQAALSGGG